MTKSKLPPGFSKLQTSQGQVFFVDSAGHKYWYDPTVPRELLNSSLNLDEIVGKLSSTWEIKQAPSGKIYYVNHDRKTTQFTDPRHVAYRDYLMSILRSSNTSNKRTFKQDTPYAQNKSRNNISTSTNNISNHNHDQLVVTNIVHSNNININFNNSTITSNDSSINLSISSSNQHHNHNNNNSISSNILFNNNNQDNNNHSNNHSQLNHNNNLHPINLQIQQTKNKQQHDEQQLLNVSLNSKQLLSDKISLLRQELLKQQQITHPYRIDIRRKRIFEESFRIISRMRASDLKKRLLVKFKGEEGLDFGGVAREWFYLLSREMLNPVHGLFQYTSDDIYNLQINPDSGIVYREHLAYMHFCGRIIGLAVFHGHFIEGHFTVPFYKMLLRLPITLDDIRNVDPELHRSLCWMLENDINDIFDDTTFLIQHNAFGKLQEHELKENGKDMVVTDKNKEEYVSLYVNYRCRRGIERQFEALQRGFDELIAPSLLRNFNEHELELLIGGLSKINVDDWQLNTKLKNCNVETALVKWFWEIVRNEYDEDKRARLLQFVTGSPRVPIQGFKSLRGVNSEPRPFTIHLIKNGNTNDLPKSHTCFNRLDLPAYGAYDRLRDKLTQAIEETMGFAIQ